MEPGVPPSWRHGRGGRPPLLPHPLYGIRRDRDPALPAAGGPRSRAQQGLPRTRYGVRSLGEWQAVRGHLHRGRHRSSTLTEFGLRPSGAVRLVITRPRETRDQTFIRRALEHCRGGPIQSVGKSPVVHCGPNRINPIRRSIRCPSAGDSHAATVLLRGKSASHTQQWTPCLA